MAGLPRVLTTLLALLTPLASTGAQVADLGTIDVPNSGNEAAQEPFLRGALLLHSFEYADAAEAFAAAQRADPGFALAYWGEALTHQHVLWNEEDRDAARAVLERLAPTRDERLAAAPPGRERGLLAAVELLFGEGERPERLQAYSAAMGALAEQFRDDLEVRSLYALSILGTSGRGRDFRVYMRAAAVAEDVYAENSDHPGALHYLIHCYDDPVHAPLGLRLARRYDHVAPAAAHALHMPSHIYVALGLWDESAAANVAAVAAADARRERKGLSLEDRGYHALWWLAYSRLQQGRHAEAAALLAEVAGNAAEHDSRTTRYHLAVMAAAHLVETGTTAGPAAEVELDPAGLSVAPAAAHLLARGLAALARDDVDAARSARAALRRRIGTALASGDDDETVDPSSGRRPDADAEADAELLDDGPALGCCAPAVATDPTSPPGRRAAFVMEQLLQARLLLHAGETDEALAVLARAAAAEDGMTYDFGPPVVVKPAHELYGEVLLELGRPAEAVHEFEAALARAPRRSRSLLGLARAAARAGDAPLARATLDDLAAVWHAADEPLRALLATERTALD